MGLAAGAVLVAGGTSTAPALAGTAADGELGVVTITASDQYIRPGYSCAYPIHFSVASTNSWELIVTVNGPRGAVAGIPHPVGQGAASGDLSMYLCDDLDPIGTYTVNAKLSTIVGPTTAGASFVLRKAPAKASLAVAPAVSKTGGTVTLSGKVTYLKGAPGYYSLPRATATLQYQLRGTTTWRTFAPSFQTTASGGFKRACRFPFSTSARFRVKVSVERLTAQSYSPTVYVSRVQ